MLPCSHRCEPCPPHHCLRAIRRARRAASTPSPIIASDDGPPDVEEQPLPPPSRARSKGPGFGGSGTWSSRTVTSVVQLAVLPASSFAVYVSVVSPTAKRVCEGTNT